MIKNSITDKSPIIKETLKDLFDYGPSGSRSVLFVQLRTAIQQMMIREQYEKNNMHKSRINDTTNTT